MPTPGWSSILRRRRLANGCAAACLGQAPVPVPASEGLEDLRTIEAILRSAASGRPTEV